MKYFWVKYFTQILFTQIFSWICKTPIFRLYAKKDVILPTEIECTVAKKMDSGARLPGLKCRLSSIISVVLAELISLCWRVLFFFFLIWTSILNPTSQNSARIKWINNLIILRNIKFYVNVLLCSATRENF